MRDRDGSVRSLVCSEIEHDFVDVASQKRWLNCDHLLNCDRFLQSTKHEESGWLQNACGSFELSTPLLTLPANDDGISQAKLGRLR